MANSTDHLVGALPPPPGVQPNFVNPYNRGPIYIVLSSIFIALPTFFVGVRLWARFIVQKSPWWDDLVCVLALLLQAAYIGVNIWLCLHGVGKHLWNVSVEDFLLLINPGRVLADLTELSIGFTKLTLLLFYHRLFWPNFATRIGTYIGIAFVIVVYGSLFFLFVFLDVKKTVATNQTIAVVNVFSDFYILVLPITAVLQLHLSRKKKLGLVALFSTGFSVCVLSIVGAVYRFRFALDGTDFTWGLIDVILINTIECSVGIMCACLPLFPAVFGSSTILENWVISMRSLRNRILNSRETHSLNSIPRAAKSDCEAGSIGTGGAGYSEQESSTNAAMHHSSLSVELGAVPNIHSGPHPQAKMDHLEHSSALYSARVLSNDQFQNYSSHHNGIEVRKEFRVDSRSLSS